MYKVWQSLAPRLGTFSWHIFYEVSPSLSCMGHILAAFLMSGLTLCSYDYNHIHIFFPFDVADFSLEIDTMLLR